MPDESAATGRELREADTTFRPRIYCAVVQPPEGGAPVTAVTTVHKDDYDEALSRIAELTDQLVAATDARDRYGALLGEIKVAMDAQIGGGTGPDPIAVANTIRRTLRRTNAR